MRLFRAGGLAMLTAVAARASCLEAVRGVAYPSLARQARIQGEVEARFLVRDGRAESITTEGHGLLAREATGSISRATFGRECAGDFRLSVVYLLDGIEGSSSHRVDFDGKETFTVTAAPAGIQCVLLGQREPAWRRAFTAVRAGFGFRRGFP